MELIVVQLLSAHLEQADPEIYSILQKVTHIFWYFSDHELLILNRKRGDKNILSI